MNRHLISIAVAGILAAATVAAAAEFTEQATVDGGARITNGLRSPGHASTGALLFVGPDLKNQFLDCSGVLIGCRTFLTAAHCICKTAPDATACRAEVEAEFPETADLRVYLQHAGVFHVRGIKISPRYKRGVRADLAVLRLSDKVTGIAPAKINRSRSPRAGDPGVIVGFGGIDENGTGEALKRFGQVSVADCPRGIWEPANVCWNYAANPGTAGADSNTCPGDDGGPLFANVGEGVVVAGIHAGNEPNCNPGSVSFDSDVYRNRGWISAAAGADINSLTCDGIPPEGLPQVGDDLVVTQVLDGKILRKEQELTHSFLIPSRTTELRIIINGDTKDGGDYDMFVGINRVPTKLDADCRVRGVGQFGACSFAGPEEGEAHVLIRHMRLGQGRGRSLFQLTATAFRGPPLGPVPRAPERLRFEDRSTKRRRLTWRDRSNDELGFIVQRKIGNDINEFFDYKILGPNKTKFTDVIDPELIYTYRIRAFNQNGVSDFSNRCIVNEQKVERPLGLRATAVGKGFISLIWRDRSNNESGFDLQRKEKGQPDRAFETIVITGQNERTYVDRTFEPDQILFPDKVYVYRVKARGRPGECVPNSRWSRRRTVDSSVFFSE